MSAARIKSFSLIWTSKRLRDAARRGATAVEFALLAGPFFLLLMGTMEMGLMFGAQQLLENATFNIARLVKTGATNGASQATTISNYLNTELSSYGSLINPANVTMTAYAYDTFSAASVGCGQLCTGSYGTASQIVVYTITYPWHIFTPLIGSIFGNPVTLTSQVVVRNEPYGP